MKAQWIVGFIREPKGLIGHSRLFKSEPCKWSLFSWVCLLFPKRESTAREVHFSQGKPRIATPLPATCTVLHPKLPMHFFAVESWCCRHVVFKSDVHGSEWSKWLWPISNVQVLRDLSGLLGFCRVYPKNFPAKGLKILPNVSYVNE